MALEIQAQEDDCVVLSDASRKQTLVVVTDGDKGVWDIAQEADREDLKRRHFVTFAWAVQFLRAGE